MSESPILHLTQPNSDGPALPAYLGAYRIEGRIARGGMGEVLLGRDEGLDRPVAIKRLRPDGRWAPHRRERFRREARTAALLDHPAIVRVYDFLDLEDDLCLVMEFVEGPTLRRALRQGPLPLRLALEIAISLSDALSTAHHQGIVHRDLKTENVMLTEDSRVKIMDFGIAKRLLEGEAPRSRTQALLGTCRAMAPEQALGDAVDPRSDLFSLGVLLYEMLTTVSPFEDKNDLLTLRRLIDEPHRSARALRPEIPRRLSGLIDRLLAKKPVHRPRQAADVVLELISIAFELEEQQTTLSPLEGFRQKLLSALGR